MPNENKERQHEIEETLTEISVLQNVTPRGPVGQSRADDRARTGPTTARWSLTRPKGIHHDGQQTSWFHTTVEVLCIYSRPGKNKSKVKKLRQNGGELERIEVSRHRTGLPTLSGNVVHPLQSHDG